MRENGKVIFKISFYFQTSPEHDSPDLPASEEAVLQVCTDMSLKIV
jgi:hypothetical protein